MNAPPSRLTPCLFALLVLSAQATEWIVKFDVDEQKTTTSADGKTPPKTAKRHFTETIALHKDYVMAGDDHRRALYDFSRFLLTTVDLETKVYERGSLYPTAAFMEHELANRNMLGGAMRAAHLGPAGLQFDRFWNETALHMESRDAPPDAPEPKIDTAQAAGATVFRHADEVVVRFVPSKERLSPILHHRFVNYLAYQCDLHPRIRQVIADTGVLPQEMTLHGRNMNITTVVTFRLLSSQLAESDSRLLPPGVHPAPPAADNPLLAVLAGVGAVTLKPERPTATEAVNRADEFVAGGHLLDAVLTLIEFGLVTGEQVPEAIRAHRDAISADPQCLAYFKAFDQSSKEAAEKSLAVNEAIERKTLAKAYMLDVQRANLLEAAGRPGEAIPLFLGVLRANPYHTGALHDLGMIFARHYEEFQAWRCWDAARQLYPQHPMMREITQFERDLALRQLDFF